MSRSIARYPILALSLIPFVAGCGGSDQTKTTSSSVGATPTVSASAPESGNDIPVTVSPVSYEAAEDVFEKGHYSEATQLFDAYTVTHPDNAWGHYMLGLSAWKAGEDEKALHAFDKALELDSAHRKSLFNSSRVLLENDRAKDALERIEKALAIEPMSNEGLRLLGRARYELGDIEDAIQAYRRALCLDERDVWSMNNLGLIYIQQGRSNEAMPPLARAVELRSNSPVFQNNLGTSLERSGYPTAAARAYEAAIEVDSTYAKAAVALARVTGGGQQPESTSVDLAALSQEFQAQIETWRGTTGGIDSTTVPVTAESDSSAVSDSTVTDSIPVSGGEVSDTLEAEEGC